MTKKLFSIIAIALLIQGTFIYGQQKISVGQKVPEWVFEDAERADFTMDSWSGKVLQINYVDPDDSDLNDGFNDYINKLTTIEKRIDRDKFKGFGIVDCKSSRKPNGLIRIVAGNKAKKYDTTILFDYDGELQNTWGLPSDNYTVVIVDKQRICRAVYSGLVPETEYENIAQLIIKYSNE
jgi:predicted transcriptional regulator